MAPVDLQRLLQPVEPGVADVRPIEEGHEIEQTEPGDEFQVESQEEFLVLEPAAHHQVSTHFPSRVRGATRTRRSIESTYDACPLGFTQVCIRIGRQLAVAQILEATGRNANPLLVVGRGVTTVAVASDDMLSRCLHRGSVARNGYLHNCDDERRGARERKGGENGV